MTAYLLLHTLGTCFY